MLERIKRYQIWGNESFQTGYGRKKVLSVIKQSIGNQLVKVITGQRRCGKSYLIRQIIKMLAGSKTAPESTLYINMELAPFNFITSADVLLDLVKVFRQSLPDNKKCYIFIDEVQKITDWEEAVSSLAQDFVDKSEVFISGSNASLLSGELATLLSGRYVAFNLFPFSYSEFLGITKLTPSLDTFVNYMQEGGMPECFRLPDSETRGHYILNLRDSIVLRDIVKRYQIRDVRLLEQLIDLLIDCVGGLFSINKLVKTLGSAKVKTNAMTIGNYIEYLKDVFFIHEAPRFDLVGRKILTGERKFYLNDPSFRFYSSYLKNRDPGKYLENAVYTHLLREGYKVQVGSVSGKEIDFVAERNKELIYIQVAYLLNSQSVLEREFGNLEKIKDNYRKIVISLDPVSFEEINGIEHILAWKFCL